MVTGVRLGSAQADVVRPPAGQAHVPLVIACVPRIIRLRGFFPDSSVSSVQTDVALSNWIQPPPRDDLLRIGELFREFRTALQRNAHRQNVPDREM